MREARAGGHQGTASPGVVTAVALGAALVLLACGGDGRPAPDTAAGVPAPAPAETAPVAGVADSAPAVPDEVREFLRYVDTQRAPDSTIVARDFTAEGLRLLTVAIETLALRDSAAATAMRPRLQVLRARTDSMLQAPDSAARARLASDAVVLSSDLLQSLQTLQDGGRPALTDRAGEARQAAAAIRSDQPLREQTDALRRYFDRAGAVLRGLVGVRTA